MKRVVVPLMIFASGAFMAVAWLGHLKMRSRGFLPALAMSWAIVLPEYVLNVAATRTGHGVFTGAQMAAMHLASGVLCVALVSRYLLGEELGLSRMAGLALLAVGMFLMMRTS